MLNVHCYGIELTAPTGWSLFSPEAPSICIPAKTTTPVFVNVNKPLGPGALGETGEIGLTMIEQDKGAITGSTQANVTLFRPPATIAFDNRQIGPIRPNGTDTVELTLDLYDDLGQRIGYSGSFNGHIEATGGTVEVPTGMYDNGRLRVVFTARDNTGHGHHQRHRRGWPDGRRGPSNWPSRRVAESPSPPRPST